MTEQRAAWTIIPREQREPDKPLTETMCSRQAKEIKLPRADKDISSH